MSNILIFPTDTVYGLATPLFDIEGIKRIYNIKGRDFNKPLAVLISDINQISSYVKMDDDFKKLSDHFWPGALTIIVKTTDVYKLKTNEDTIGLRMPNNNIALKIINELGPLKTTSVNKSGQQPLNDYNQIHKEYNHLVDVIYKDDQINKSNISSTVIDITKKPYQVLREGEISIEQINKVINTL